MSAGGISYKGVIGHKAQMTLPSVETWSSNMNILRDPPKSIHTRKIDKVGETSEITQMVQESGDRMTEAVSVYARGVNPMVGVSYSNYGNNGGQRTGTSGQQVNGGTQAFLPYRIMRDGAFRPPAWSARNLTPLSRMPRVWTSSFTQPGFTDYSKKAMCPGTDEQTKGVKNPDRMLKACIRPTATYKIETPIVEPFEVKYVIQNPIKVSGHSGIESQGKFNAVPSDPKNYIINEPLRQQVNMNLGSRETVQDINVRNFNTEKYMQQPLHAQVESNRSQNIQTTSIDELYDLDDKSHIQNRININYTAPQTSYTKTKYIHGDVELERSLPQHHATTNIGQNIHKRTEHVSERQYSQNRPTPNVESSRGVNSRQVVDNISSREYHLKPTVNAGGYSQNVGIPKITRQQIVEFDSQKTQMNQRIYDLQQGRQYDNGVNPYDRHS